jgi:lactoylglutathione lyase
MRLIHTCYRVLDLERSAEFYAQLGFEEIGRMPIGTEATNLFMNLPGDGNEPRLELTFNHDRTEPYDIGTGYGHIALAVGDLDETLERLAAIGIEPERPPYSVREGGTRLCFVRDPDGYRIELLGRD